jgi:iron complex outermembrane receptor protein
VVSAFLGNGDFKSEVLVAYEAGYRTRPVEFITADLAFFYNLYDRLRSVEGPGASFTETDPPPQHLVVPFVLANGLDGHTWGAEAALNVQAARGVLIRANYAYLRMHLSDDASEGRDPQHTAWIRARLDLGPGWNLDAIARYVSRLKAFDIDGYIEGDVRLAWKAPDRNLEVALVGQNLVHESHPEFNAEASRNEIERGVYLSILWGF